MSAADGRDGFEILEALRAPADGCVLCRLEERWLRELGVELAQPREISPG